jgi:uncharacterized membrane protein YczE
VDAREWADAGGVVVEAPGSPPHAAIASDGVAPSTATRVTNRRRPYEPRNAGVDWAIRLARCVTGLALFGIGIALLLQSDLGAAPWDVFHQGVSELTGISIGNVIVITGVLLLLLWIPLHQRPGVGTLLNALEIGLVLDLVLPRLPEVEAIPGRVAYLLVGLVIIALGSGLYIGSGLGAGPRDGIMMGLKERGLSVRVARTAVEVIVLVVGIALGGTAGVGTVLFAVGIGPLVQLFLPPLSLPPRRRDPTIVFAVTDVVVANTNAE